MRAAISLVLILVFLPAAGQARWPSYGFYFENDVDFLSGEQNDRFYTNGVRIDVSWPNCTLPRALQKRWQEKQALWVPFVPDGGSPESCTPGEMIVGLDASVDVFSFGLRLGQSLYTPNDTQVATLQTRDRPYAAWLYAGAVVSRMSMAHMRSLALDIGTVGPSALGQEVQDWVHKDITDSLLAQGWGHQIRDEPAVLFTWEERWRPVVRSIAITRVVEGQKVTGPVIVFDLVPRYYANLGNVFTQVAGSTTARFGWNVPADFGPATRIVSLQAGEGSGGLPNRWELYGFVAAEARGVARNIFLDGNLFATSHSVPKEVLVADLEWGFVVRYREVRLTYRRVRRTKEFAFQPESQRFGSLNLTWNIPYRPN